MTIAEAVRLELQNKLNASTDKSWTVVINHKHSDTQYRCYTEGLPNGMRGIATEYIFQLDVKYKFNDVAKLAEELSEFILTIYNGPVIQP